MIDTSDVYFFWVEEPLHAGSGSSTGATDLPIQRERHTGFPIVQYSGVKGVVRAHCREVWKADRGTDAERKLFAVFGPDTSSASDHAGAVSFSQMRVLLFPVASLYGLFAWITCPSALEAFVRRLERAGPVATNALSSVFSAWDTITKPQTALVAPDSPLCEPLPRGQGQPKQAGTLLQYLTLETSTFAAASNPAVSALGMWLTQNTVPTTAGYQYTKNRLSKQVHLAILPDEDFMHFVQQSTTVTARNKINPDTGTVTDTGLWTEETLPPDTLLFTTAQFSPPEGKKPGQIPDVLREPPGATGRPSARKVRAEVRQALTARPIVQIGGNATVGCGLTRVVCLAKEPPQGQAASQTPQERQELPPLEAQHGR